MNTKLLENVGVTMAVVGTVIYWATAKTDYSMPLVTVGLFFAVIGGLLSGFKKR